MSSKYISCDFVISYGNMNIFIFLKDNIFYVSAAPTVSKVRGLLTVEEFSEAANIDIVQEVYSTHKKLLFKKELEKVLKD